MEHHYLKLLDTYILDDVLMELSGLALLNEHTFIAVQDEKGIIYHLNKNNGEIIAKNKFKKKGDFEGVALVSSEEFYAVTSEGELYRISSLGSEKVSKKIKGVEIEGLCYAPQKHKLLLAVKRGEDKYIRVLGFDLHNMQWDQEDHIKLKKDRSTKQFHCSGIALDSKGNCFLLSHRSKQLLILNQAKEILQLVDLSPFDIFQPESILIENDTCLYIGSEGKKGIAKPKLYKFSYTKP